MKAIVEQSSVTKAVESSVPFLLLDLCLIYSLLTYSQLLSGTHMEIS